MKRRPSQLLNNLLRSIRNDDLSLAEYGRLFRRSDTQMDLLCSDAWGDRSAFIADLSKHYGTNLSPKEVFGTTLGGFLKLMPTNALAKPPRGYAYGRTRM